MCGIFACANMGMVLPIFGQTYIPTAGTTKWLTEENWSTETVPNGVDATAVLQQISVPAVAATEIDGTITLGHLQADVSTRNWIVRGTGAEIYWETSGETLPSITLDNTGATANNLTISANFRDAVGGPPKALNINMVDTDEENNGAGLIVSGNNSNFTGGFNLISSYTHYVTFVYESSLANNTVNVLSGHKQIRLGSGETVRTFSSDFNVAGDRLSLYSSALTAGKVILDGTISGSGEVYYWTYNGGAMELQGENTYAGNTLIASSLNLIFDGVDNFGTGNSIIFAYSGNSPTLIWAEGNTDDITKKADGTTRAINLQTANVKFNIGSNDVTFANKIIGYNLPTTGTAPGSGITKQGAGTLRLLADNTYVISTLVEEGTLLANNTTESATGTSAVTVNAGATFGGTGTIRPGVDRSVTIKTDAVLSAGDNGIGNFTIDLNDTTGTLNFEDNSIIAVDLGDAFTADLLTLSASTSGSVIFLGNTKINISDVSTMGLEVGDYQLFSAANSAVYSGLTIFEGEITGGLTIGENLTGFDFSLWMDGGDIYLKMSVVPEPGTAVLLGLTFLSLTFRQRTARSSRR